MTRKQEPSDVRDAWISLYGEGGRDLTSEGFKEALKGLRYKDPARAKRVERLLAPYLENLFPRRKWRFSKTSQGIKARLALLPNNPHVEIDIGTIRKALRIPHEHVKVSEGDEAWTDLEDLVDPDKIEPNKIRRVAEGNLASAWLSGHRLAAMEKPIEWNDVLPLKMRQSAIRSARVNLATSDVPEWLRQPLVDSEAYPCSPMDHAAHKLALRHGLPNHTITALEFYILTEDPSKNPKGRVPRVLPVGE